MSCVELEMKSIKQWEQDVFEVTGDMINWALNFKEKKKPNEDDEPFDIKKKHFVFAAVIIISIALGIVLGYYLGLNISRNHYIPLLENACKGCICLN